MILRLKISFFLILALQFLYSCDKTFKNKVFNKNIYSNMQEKKFKSKNKSKSKNSNSDISEPLIKGDFSQMMYCPSGSVFAYSGEAGNNLYIKYENKKDPILILTKNGVGNNIGWNKKCNQIYFKEKTKNYKIIIKSIDINTLEINEFPEYDAGVNLSSLSISDTVYNLDLRTHDIFATYNRKRWLVTKRKGNYYKILLSPNNKFFVAHEGAYVLLFNTKGDFIRKLGNGIATQWTADSKSLIGFKDTSADGEIINGSDLYQFFISETTPKQITFTPDIYEMWPTIGPNKEILYSDGLNGGIYKLKQKL